MLTRRSLQIPPLRRCSEAIPGFTRGAATRGKLYHSACPAKPKAKTGLTYRLFSWAPTKPCVVNMQGSVSSMFKILGLWLKHRVNGLFHIELSNIKPCLLLLLVLNVIIPNAGHAAVADTDVKPVIFDDSVFFVHIKARQWLPAKLYAAPRIDPAIISQPKRIFRNVMVMTSVPVLGFAGLLGIASTIQFFGLLAVKGYKILYGKADSNSGGNGITVSLLGGLTTVLIALMGSAMLCKVTLGPNPKLAQADLGQPVQKK